jgi:hypothetical protein
LNIVRGTPAAAFPVELTGHEEVTNGARSHT